LLKPLGVSLSTVNRAHMAYDRDGIKALKPKPNGGRKRENMTVAEEKALLSRFAKTAGAGGDVWLLSSPFVSDARRWRVQRRSPWCDDRISLYPAAPFRLANLLHAWTIAGRTGLIFDTADGLAQICESP
jgi:Winged helix-turn helix